PARPVPPALPADLPPFPFARTPASDAPPAPPAPPEAVPVPPAPPEAPSVPPWFRPRGDDAASARFRDGTEPATTPPPRPLPAPPAAGVRAGIGPRPLAPPTLVRPETKTIEGEISATPGRAEQSARVQLSRAVTQWVSPEVPAAWHAPAPLIDGLV